MRRGWRRRGAVRGGLGCVPERSTAVGSALEAAAVPGPGSGREPWVGAGFEDCCSSFGPERRAWLERKAPAEGQDDEKNASVSGFLHGTTGFILYLEARYGECETRNKAGL